MILKRIANIVILAVLCCREVRPANILFFHHVISYSHRIASYPLASALADQGHHVTFITPQPLKPDTVEVNPKIVEIVPRQFEILVKSFFANSVDINLRIHKLFPTFADIYFSAGFVGCQGLWATPEFKEFVNNNTTNTKQRLDLIITDSAIGECITPLAYLFNAKLVVLGTILTMPYEYDQYGFQPESASIPEANHEPEKRIPMVEGLGLMARLRNTWLSLHWRYEHYQYMSKLDGLVREHLPQLELEGMPHLDQVARNVSLFLSTSDLVTDYPRAQPPLFVNVAGMHCRAGKPLPAELKDFIGNGSEGFIYMSTGTAVRAPNLPERIKQVFFSTMESFPKLRFLWKWDGKIPKSYPRNLHFAQWYPQQDLLAHPKIKAFVTQNGRPSSVEAVCHAVPMISVPVIGDQDSNANRLNELGANVILELGTLSQEELKEAIYRTAVGSRIKNRMLELQKLLLDQPMAPVEKAVWWVEYVLRHKDTAHLRSPGFSQSWVRRRLLDVWGLLFGAFFVAMLLLFKILTAFVRMIFKNNKKKNPSSSSSKRAKND